MDYEIFLLPCCVVIMCFILYKIHLCISSELDEIDRQMIRAHRFSKDESA